MGRLCVEKEESEERRKGGRGCGEKRRSKEKGDGIRLLVREKKRQTR
jgi:hypothetical protein